MTATTRDEAWSEPTHSSLAPTFEADRDRRRPRILAFYLPQFHTIPENDAWWGRGFTEWAKVVRAGPQFAGHYQPHLPSTLGFYDLRVSETRESQAAMARAHGIDGFCYYHYWLGGHRPFWRVVDEIIDTGRPDFPFCFCWANHHWARTWDQAEHELLIRQEYSAADDLEHIRYLIEVFRDPRYIRVEGRPLLLIFRAHDLPDPRTTFAVWREECARASVPEPLIVRFDTADNLGEPSRHGCDASAQFLPHGIHGLVPSIRLPDASPAHAVYDYADVVRGFIEKQDIAWKRYECVFPSWDNTPRRAALGALIVNGHTPELFEAWLSAVYARAGDDGLVFVNAWNEWGESAHLEPDERWGDAFLRAVARVSLGSVPAELPQLSLSAQPALSGRTLEERYHSLYEGYVRIQRNLTALERMVERRFHTTLDAEQPVVDLRARRAG